jgi:hypothetical protein
MKMAIDLLKELFYYEKGKLFNKARVKNPETGFMDRIEAGMVDKKGEYRFVMISKKRYHTHRLIYMLHYGYIPNHTQIVHLDKNKLNNNIKNLQLATSKENGFNPKINGVCYSEVQKKYETYVMVNGKKVHLGYFDTEEEAKLVYLGAKRKLQKIARRI